MKNSTSVLFFMSSLKRVPMKDSTSVLFFMSSLNRGTNERQHFGAVFHVFPQQGYQSTDTEDSVSFDFFPHKRGIQHPRRECVVLKRGIGCTSLTWECCLPPPSRSRNALKPTGTGSSRGPRSRGMGAQMFNSDECVRV